MLFFEKSTRIKILDGHGMERDWESGGRFVIHDVCKWEVRKRGYWKGGVFLAAGKCVSEGHGGLMGIA